MRPYNSNASEFITPIGSAADASNWLTATLKVGSSLGVTVPCQKLNVSSDICALAAVPFGGVEPSLLPSAVFISTLMKTLETYPEFGQYISQRQNASAVITSTYVNTLTVPVSDDYALRRNIFEDITKVDGLASKLFVNNDAVGFESQAPRSFTFHDNLVYWQTDAVLWDELITNLSFAGVGVFIVCFLTLMHPAALIATAGVGVVDIFLFGSLYIGSIRFNVISVINFVMAVGLAVDYTLHFCHAFLAAPGADRVAKVKYTLQTMGSSILKGGGTTLIGILPMAFSMSTIFRTFFALLFSTVAYALLVGMVLLPVVMSVLPMPSAPHLQHDSSDTTVTFGKALQRLEDRLVDMEKEELEQGKSGQ